MRMHRQALLFHSLDWKWIGNKYNSGRLVRTRRLWWQGESDREGCITGLFCFIALIGNGWETNTTVEDWFTHDDYGGREKVTEKVIRPVTHQKSHVA
jgi:hypothetical protein